MLVVASVTVGIVMLAALQARQGSTRSPARAVTLTPADYMEIQQLAVRYSYAIDSGADGGEMLANLFAPDGAFLSATRGRIEGHDRLVTLGRGRGPNPPRRFIVNHVVTPTPQGATGRAYVVEVELPPDGEIGGKLTSTGGRYEDVYEKTPAGWRFKSREFIPSKVGSDAAAAPSSPAAPTQPGTAARPDAPTRQADTKAKPTTKATRALTAADYIEIQQLVSRYGYAIDSGADNGTGSVYGGLFTTDGEFHGPSGVPGGDPLNARGTDALAALVRHPADRDQSTRVSHFLMNHLIEPTAEGATGQVYLLVIIFGRDGKPSSLMMGGHYDDIYAQTPEGWRFKSRTFFRGSFGPDPKPETGVAKAQPIKSPSPVKASTLTPMDYIEIRKLVANYGYGLDTGADNGGMYADLFAPDGSIFGRSGRENILALARREPHGPHYTRHFLTNVLIEPSPEGATGKQYLAVIDIGENGNPSSFFLGGRYEDTYVKTPQGWRFKSRNLVRANSGPASQTGSSGRGSQPAQPAAAR
jgi:hypothetical protein